LLSAIRMTESGFASATDVDRGMELGCAHPMGPLRLADLIGLDTVASIAESLYEEFKEPLYAPPPLLLRMVEAGLLGRKTCRGLHVYDRRGGTRWPRPTPLGGSAEHRVRARRSAREGGGAGGDVAPPALRLALARHSSLVTRHSSPRCLTSRSGSWTTAVTPWTTPVR